LEFFNRHKKALFEDSKTMMSGSKEGIHMTTHGSEKENENGNLETIILARTAPIEIIQARKPSPLQSFPDLSQAGVLSSSLKDEVSAHSESNSFNSSPETQESFLIALQSNDTSLGEGDISSSDSSDSPDLEKAKSPAVTLQSPALILNNIAANIKNSLLKPLHPDFTNNPERRAISQLVEEGAEFYSMFQEGKATVETIIDHRGRLPSVMYTIGRLASNHGRDNSKFVHPHRDNHLGAYGIVKENAEIRHFNSRPARVELNKSIAYLMICLYGQPLTGKDLKDKLNEYQRRGVGIVKIWIGKYDYIHLPNHQAGKYAVDQITDWLTENEFLQDKAYASLIQINSRRKCPKLYEMRNKQIKVVFVDDESDEISKEEAIAFKIAREQYFSNMLPYTSVQTDSEKNAKDFVVRQNDNYMIALKNAAQKPNAEEKSVNKSPSTSNPQKVKQKQKSPQIFAEPQTEVSEMVDTRGAVIHTAKSAKPEEISNLAQFMVDYEEKKEKVRRQKRNGFFYHPSQIPQPPMREPSPANSRGVLNFMGQQNAQQPVNPSSSPVNSLTKPRRNG